MSPFIWMLWMVTIGAAVLTPPRAPPGALLHHNGRINIIQDTITVKLAFDLDSLPGQIVEIREKLENLKQDLSSITEEAARKDLIDTIGKGYFNLCQYRYNGLIQEIDTLLLDLGFHERHPSSAQASFREKRGLFNFVGILSKSLFGIATEKDVKDINKMVEKKINDNMGKVFHAVYDNQEQLFTRVNTLSELSNRQSSQMLELQGTINYLAAVGLIANSLLDFDKAITNLKLTVQNIKQDILDAATNQVTSRLLPIHSLKRLVAEGSKALHKNLLFSLDDIDYYYPLLETSLTMDGIYIHIPLKASTSYDIWIVHPFPFYLNHTLVTLDINPQAIILSNPRTLMATSSPNILDSCKGSYDKLHTCPSSLFSFRPIHKHPCLADLVFKNDSTKCPLTLADPDICYHTYVPPFNYFFFPQKSAVAFVCLNEGGQESHLWKEILGLIHVSPECTVTSQDLFVEPSRHHIVDQISIARVTPVNLTLDIQLWHQKPEKQRELKRLIQKKIKLDNWETSPLDEPLHWVNTVGTGTAFMVLLVVGWCYLKYRSASNRVKATLKRLDTKLHKNNEESEVETTSG